MLRLSRLKPVVPAPDRADAVVDVHVFRYASVEPQTTYFLYFPKRVESIYLTRPGAFRYVL